MTVPVRIQRQRTKGWRMPEGAVYVGRPTIFGNPWTLADAREYGIPPEERAAWLVRRYRDELDHLGLMSDWADRVSDAAFWRMCDTLEEVDPLRHDQDGKVQRSIRPLFRHLLRDATALACWCPLTEPCHADVLIELLAETAR